MVYNFYQGFPVERNQLIEELNNIVSEKEYWKSS